MSRSSYSVNTKVHPQVLINLEPYLITERMLEGNGQQWVENVNLIEEFLLKLVQRVGLNVPRLKSTFVIRRLPNFMVTFTNRNEYAVLLDNFDFSLVPHDPTQKPIADRVGKPNFGQIEIFLPRKRTDESRKCEPVHTPPPETFMGSNGTSTMGTMKVEEEDDDKCSAFLNRNKAYCSHEMFKEFALRFECAFKNVLLRDDDEFEKTEPGQYVQIIGPHLLKNLKGNQEVSKIFRVITTSPIRLSPDTKQKFKVKVDLLRSSISLSYQGTEVIIKPGLFYEHGYHRVNNNLTERIPLYHASMLTVAESLLKGCLLFPTSFETLWTLQFWPSESHIVSLFHQSSIPMRLFKIYGCFCLNPAHFYETLSGAFLLDSLDDLAGLLVEDDDHKRLTMDFFISSFLYELEEFSGIEDWAPRNFSTRLLHLLKSAIDSFEKGFHGHYFTKINVLRGLWRNDDDRNKRSRTPEDYTSGGNLSTKRSDNDNLLKGSSSFRTSSPENVDDYKDDTPTFLETDDLDDEFGLRFDDLNIHDEPKGATSPPKLTSDLVYQSVNPFDELFGVTTATESQSRGTAKSLVNFIKKFGGRGGSEGGSARAKSTQNTVRSMADVASEFEKSVALQRARPSLFPFPIAENEGDIASTQNLVSVGGNKPGASFSQQQYENDAFDDDGLLNTASENGRREDSIYDIILQSMKQLPPSDLASDPGILEFIAKTKKAMESQEELIMSWGRVMSDIPKPKFICPHAFSPRQIQYLAKVIQVVSRCSPSTIKIIRSVKLPSWEISGDILRIVLHQMRSESQALNNAPGELCPPKKSHSFLIPSRILPSRPSFKSFKRNSSGDSDPCKSHNHEDLIGSGKIFDRNDIKRNQSETINEEMQLALEDPETAATNRLLQWLWQLRTSEIGRLSTRANKYLEELYTTSMVNSHFLEQHAEEKCFEALAMRSAIAVTKIMESGKFPAHVPLSAAARKGWLWAEMVLSLASWNQEKGLDMKAYVPIFSHDRDDYDDDNKNIGKLSYIARAIHNTTGDVSACGPGGGGVEVGGTVTRRKKMIELEPDLDAVTLAFHSELATPIGWNDIEDPRQPGPLTVPIMIFSSLAYYKLWEMVPGNLVHALVRLQKFNTLQHVGNLLTHPHRKTALNEVRKLNKSTSFRIHNFENTIMSKTFKRLASIRTTSERKRRAESMRKTSKCLSCEEAGCPRERTLPHSSLTTSVWKNDREIECTKL